MSNFWWTADQHFGHANIMLHCNRQFATLETMNEYMIEIWNQYVKPRDTVCVLGDFYWGPRPEDAMKISKRLHGQKIFIKGNHDRWYKKQKRYMYNKKVDGLIVWGCHYPLATWPSGVQLHGHCHGNLERHVNRFDVGVDTNPEYRPYHHDEIKSWVDWDMIDKRKRSGRYEEKE